MTYAHEPTIGLLELSSIARGIECCDRVLKQAVVRVLIARPVSGGKYVLLFTGSVEDVRSSLDAGRALAADLMVDELLLPAAHEGVLAALGRPVEVPELDAVGVLETWTVAAALRAADAAAKRSDVRLIELHLAIGIGGKSYFTLAGEVSDVEEAIETAAAPERARGLVVSQVVIPRPEPAMRDLLGGHQRPIGE